MSSDLTLNPQQQSDLVQIKKLAIEYGKNIESALIDLIVAIMATLNTPTFKGISVRDFASKLAGLAMDNQESDYIGKSQLAKYISISQAFIDWDINEDYIRKVFCKDQASLSVKIVSQLTKLNRKRTKRVQTKTQFQTFVNKVAKLEGTKRKKFIDDKMLEVNPPKEEKPTEPTEPTQEEPTKDVGETKEVLSNTGELHLKARLTEVFEDLAKGDVPSIITEDTNSKLAIAFRGFINEASQNAELFLEAFAPTK